jgi:hypothetical protein
MTPSYFYGFSQHCLGEETAAKLCFSKDLARKTEIIPSICKKNLL